MKTPSIVKLIVPLTCLAALHGCAQTNGSSEVGLLPADHSVVFAAPAAKSIGMGNALARAGAVPEPVVFRFKREGAADDVPIYLDLIGAVDQSVKIYAAKPGTYRLVEAYLLARPGETRWLFEEAPNTLEVRDGEAAYVGTLHWRDTWVEIDNNESEARAIYQKRLQDFKGRSLKFVTRLVRGTKHTR
jgi:hypothetical protein